MKRDIPRASPSRSRSPSVVFKSASKTRHRRGYTAEGNGNVKATRTDTSSEKKRKQRPFLAATGGDDTPTPDHPFIHIDLLLVRDLLFFGICVLILVAIMAAHPAERH